MWGNTSRILFVALPGLPKASSAFTIKNIVIENNFPDPVEPSSGDVLTLLTGGIGILNVGKGLRGKLGLDFNRVVVWALEV